MKSVDLLDDSLGSDNNVDLPVEKLKAITAWSVEGKDDMILTPDEKCGSAG